MCVRCATADRLALVADARDVADALLGRYLRLDVAKAMTLGTPRGFDRAVVRLARLLQGRAADSDHAAVKAAVEVLDVDWHRTTAEQRRSLIAHALEASGRKTKDVPAKVQTVFGNAATEVVRATRDGARRDQKLAIGADFNAVDQRVIRHLRSSQANYVRDEYGRRHDAFGEEARRIVSEGLESGLGRDDIAEDLAEAAEGIIAGRSPAYWDVVAGSFVGRGLELFDRVEANPDSIEDLNPWVRDTVEPATGKRSLSIERGGERISIADIVRSGAGARDDRGEFSRGLGERELGDLGVGFPPYHGLCRTTTVAEVE